MKKVMLIGGPNEYGQPIIDKYNADWFSRSNGHNIDDAEVREKLTAQSLNYDVVLLHVHTMRDNQNTLLKEIVKLWHKEDYSGLLIVTGSIITYYDDFKDPIEYWGYTAQKSYTDTLCRVISKKFIQGKIKFKTSVIKPGQLDVARAREKKHFVNGLPPESFCDAVSFIIDQPYDVVIPEIVLDVKYHGK